MKSIEIKKEKNENNIKSINKVIAMKDSIVKMKKLCSLQLQVDYLSPAWQTITNEINKMQSVGNWFDKYLESILK